MLRRTQRLFTFDRGLGSRFVAGADEAGRGCLAGPLVAAAVLIDYESLSRADRRALGRAARLQADERRAARGDLPGVLRAAARVSVVVRCARGIDDRGLHVTNIEALSSALERLRPEPDATCLVDGFSLRRCAVPHRAVVEGDGTSAAIAAASVIAKVTRDRYMHGIAARAPGLGIRGARRLLDPRAPRGDRADRHLAAAPPLVPVGRVLAARARLTAWRPGGLVQVSEPTVDWQPHRSSIVVPPQSSGATSLSVWVRVQLWPARSRKVHWRSPYGKSRGSWTDRPDRVREPARRVRRHLRLGA